MDDESLAYVVALMVSLEDGTLKRMLSDIGDTLKRDDLPPFQKSALESWRNIVNAELDADMESKLIQ